MSQKDFWNKRFSKEEFIYGEKPNEYFKEKLSNLSSGKILLPAEGEGRNAVFAAVSGWEVVAFDSSESGKKKAEMLAEKNRATIDYQVWDVKDFQHPTPEFDVLALIYAHFPSEDRQTYHQKLTSYLKKDGVLILEGFSKNHVENQKENPSAGGPKNIDMLYDLESLKEDFKDFDFIEFKERTIKLHEGNYHNGQAEVIRIFAKKNKHEEVF